MKGKKANLLVIEEKLKGSGGQELFRIGWV